PSLTWRDGRAGGAPGPTPERLRDTGAVDIKELTRKILDRRACSGDPLRIVQAGHPALRRRAVPARGRLEPELLCELAEAMTVTMRTAPGVGLAAPQVGLPLSFYVVEDGFAGEPGEDVDDDLLERRPLALRALLDPVLEPIGTERVFAFEGCLSVEGWQSIVPRSRRVAARRRAAAGRSARGRRRGAHRLDRPDPPARDRPSGRNPLPWRVRAPVVRRRGLRGTLRGPLRGGPAPRTARRDHRPGPGGGRHRPLRGP